MSLQWTVGPSRENTVWRLGLLALEPALGLKCWINHLIFTTRK